MMEGGGMPGGGMPGGGMPGGGMMGEMGMGGGRGPGMGGMMGTGNETEQANPQEVPVEIVGIIYIYNPPDLAKVGTGTAKDETTTMPGATGTPDAAPGTTVPGTPPAAAPAAVPATTPPAAAPATPPGN
jgi:hypothetical protein